VSAPRLTAVTRRGLKRVLALAEADFESMEIADLTAAEWREVRRALEWLRHITYRDERKVQS
jgi:PHD/YefM family antitoxin component YafN of YafNO toxin-antitoxin module